MSPDLRETSIGGPCPPAPTRTRTQNLLVYQTMLQPTEPAARAAVYFFEGGPNQAPHTDEKVVISFPFGHIVLM